MAKSKQSAGILLYRLSGGQLEVLLVHPGGPFFARKDTGVWSIPKGEFDGEDRVAAAKREFAEETGAQAPDSDDYLELGSVKNKSGKTIYAFAVQGDLDVTKIKSNTFDLEWPPKSGEIRQFPEVDNAGWFDIQKAKQKVNSAQSEFVDRLCAELHIIVPSTPEQASLF
jgi:predicted NUDIX family NTP pyrophosphohydrolase